MFDCLQLEDRLNVPKDKLQIFLDDKFTKKLNGKDSDTMKVLKLKYFLIINKQALTQEWRYDSLV